MDFAQQQRKPTKHLVGITSVALLHVAIIYALVNGLAHKVVEALPKPIETKIVEEHRPPPPPEKLLPPPPKMTAPPPPYIPPVEVQVQTPVQTPVQVVTTTQPTTTTIPAPAQPAPVAAPAAPAKPASIGVVCPNVREIASSATFPPKAAREGISEGSVVVELVVGPDGAVKSSNVTSSTNRLFNDTAIKLAHSLRCSGQGGDVRLSWEIGFRLTD